LVRFLILAIHGDFHTQILHQTGSVDNINLTGLPLRVTNSHRFQGVSGLREGHIQNLDDYFSNRDLQSSGSTECRDPESLPLLGVDAIHTVSKIIRICGAIVRGYWRGFMTPVRLTQLIDCVLTIGWGVGWVCDLIIRISPA
jgi:hypothetical protein